MSRGRMNVAVNMDMVSTLIAACCFKARIIDGVSPGKMLGQRHEVIFCQMPTGAGDARVGVDVTCRQSFAFTLQLSTCRRIGSS